MSTRRYIVATAGHVDHGKSAIVKALTGTDPDRLPEEKARGITIDLGFAHLQLSTTVGGQPVTLSLGIVDVPGHEDFVKNMVAGVGSIDLALFIVAADDGWMPQSEEHLQILTYLGVRHAVVALTKIDLAEASDEAGVVARLREQLRDTPFANAPIVPTSVLTGRGLDELKSALAATLAVVPAPCDLGKPRLPIDRVFTLHGIGTVVTGTLIGGTLRRNQAVVLAPAGKAARIRSLQSHHRDAESAGPGTRVALNLPDVPSVASSPDGVARGQVVTIAGLGAPSTRLDVLLEKSGRLAGTKIPGARPLRDRALVRIHHGSANFSARVSLQPGTGPLEPGGRLLAQLRFDEPIFALAGDRFILRDWAEQSTLGGGLVLDTDTDRDEFTSETRRALLTRRVAAPEDLRVWITTELAARRALPRGRLLVQSRFSATEIAEALGRLAVEGHAVLAGEWGAERAWWQALCRKAADTVEAAHRDHPERLGLALNELRGAVERDLPAPEVFNALLADLGRAGFMQTGAVIRLASHRAALPPKLEAAGAKLRAILSAKPFEPPVKKELMPDALAQQALRFLVESGEATEVGPELVMLTEHFVQAREAIRKHLRERGGATASDLRQLLQTNRRVIIPLVERLDKDGVTLRQGDKRVLR